MKNKYLRIWLSLLFIFSVMIVFAYDIKVDGIYYDVTKAPGLESTATVTFRDSGKENASAYSGEVIIPSTFEYENEVYTVISIRDSAFNACSELTLVSIPKTVTQVGYGAFEACIGLKNVTIEEGDNPLLFSTELYRTEQGYPFFISSPLETIYMGRNIIATSQEYYAGEYISPFRGHPTLYSVVIGDKVTEILHKAFYQCTNLTEVSIGNNVKAIRERAFSGCEKLSSVVIPNSTESIAMCAFDGCSSLKTLKIGGGVKQMGMFAFSSCSNLSSLTIEDGMQEIGWYAFAGCTSLTSVVIPNSVNVIGQVAFRDCI